MATGFRQRARKKQMEYQIRRLTAVVQAQTEIIAEYLDSNPKLIILHDKNGIPHILPKGLIDEEE
jgi:hypothetical protein